MGLLGAVKKLSNRDLHGNKRTLSLKKEEENHADIYHKIAPENIELEEIRPSYEENNNDDDNEKHVYDNAAYDGDSSEESEEQTARKNATC